MDPDSLPTENDFSTWICPHCESVWSYGRNKTKACEHYLCHATDRPYVVVLDRVLCVCCEGVECYTKWRVWGKRSVTPETKIPMIYATLTKTDESRKTQD